MTIFQDIFQKDKFMGSVDVAKEGELIFSEAYGQSYKGEQQKQFVGNYTSPQLPMEIEVFTQNKKLFAQATGQNHFPMKALPEYLSGAIWPALLWSLIHLKVENIVSSS